MAAWGIGQVARRAGLATSAIRYYESEGLLPLAERHNGRRCYDETVLDQLALIDLARGAGFSIAEIRHLLHGFSQPTPASVRWRTLASSKLDEVRDRIERLQAMEDVLRRLLKCPCPTLDDCGSALREHRGRWEEE